MSGDAFLFMILSWGLILGMSLVCFILLFTRSQPPPQEGPKERFDEPEEIT